MEKKSYRIADLRKVKITGGILKQYQEIVRDRAMPYQWRVLNDLVEDADKSGAIENFRIAAGESKAAYYGMCFQDSDVGKWLEAAAYVLCWTEDPSLEARADEIIELLGRAQQEDGYLNTYFTVCDPDGRFGNIRECDELYCFGHLAEAAAAYYQATGKRRFLEIMCRYADLLCDTFGDGKGQIRACDGHPEAELAFVRLYEATGEKRYLEQAGFQLETRGSEPYYYDIEWERRGRKSFHPHLLGERPSDDRGYDQSECLLRDLDHPVGHAVKMGYLLAGMAAYSQYAKEEELYRAGRRIFYRIADRQMYVTGAVGATRHKESFTRDYHLPNDRAYGETCASAAMIFAAQRMLRVEADPYYADVMERVLYNALPAGMAMSGERFFYVNPLEVYPLDLAADHDYDAVRPVRQKWFPCACCPPNLVRMIASLGAYLYTYDEENLFINLFAESQTKLQVSRGRQVEIEQKTDYPWDGRITVRITGAQGMRVGIRIPQWCTDAALSVTGGTAEAGGKPGTPRYAFICVSEEQLTVRLELDMTPYCVTADARVKADAGKAALMRGPVVYCAEEADNGRLLHNLMIDPEKGFDVLKERYYGAPVLLARGGFRTEEDSGQEGALYRRYSRRTVPAQIRFVPYSMWGNRIQEDVPQEMLVWMRVRE